MSLSIPHGTANPLVGPSDSAALGLMLASVNADGVVVSASGGISGAASFLPRDFADRALVAQSGSIFFGKAGDGSECFYAVTPMIENELVLVGSWPASTGAVAGGGVQAAVVALTIVM